MDIEIVQDNKDIISDQSIRMWMNEPVVQTLTQFLKKCFIKDRDKYSSNRIESSEMIKDIIKQSYEQGYYKGLRDRGETNEIKESGNNWDADKVYPKNGFTLAD